MKSSKLILAISLIVCMLCSSLFSVNMNVAAIAETRDAAAATNPISEGKYFIRNSYSGKYLWHATTNSGVEIKQGEFNLVDNHMWDIRKTSDGYYTIESSPTGLHLSVEGNSNSTNAKIVGNRRGKESDGGSSSSDDYDATPLDGQKWNITTVGEGIYTLTAKCSESSNLKLCLDPTAYNNNPTANNVTLAQGNYAGRTDIVWCFYSASSSYSVSPKYDSSYKSRYSSAGTRVNNAMDKLTAVFLERFNVFISYSYASKGTSYVDNCTTSYSTSCNHGSTCQNSYYDTSNTLHLYNYHHTNLDNVIFRIPTPAHTNNFNIVFTGKSLCEVIGGTHYNDVVYGASAPILRTIIMDDFTGTISETATLVHEFGHMFGAPDHYYKGETEALNKEEYGAGSSVYKDDCIYGLNYLDDDVCKNLKICDGCYRKIMSNLKK